MNNQYDFGALSSNNIYSMDKIEWWLLKYSEKFKTTYDFVQNQHWNKQEDGTLIRLPPFWEQSKEDAFLELYESLEKISEFHRNETYFEQEIIEYHKIKNSQWELKKWTSKNESFGADEYVCFYPKYLDYSENAKHLQVCFHNPKEVQIYIDREDFKHTINFLQIFNELYWAQEILPESLEKLRNEINGLKKQSDFTQTELDCGRN